jgi:hypothetical protein
LPETLTPNLRLKPGAELVMGGTNGQVDPFGKVYG